MTDRYRLVRRGNRFYAVDRQSNTRESLGTNNRSIAQKLLAARNETARCPILNLSLGRIYYSAHDPALIHRTWADVMAEFSQRGKEHTHERRKRAMDKMAVDPYMGSDTNSPAYKAGLRGGQIIIAVNGESPNLIAREFLTWFTHKFDPGDPVRLSVLDSSGKQREISYRIPERY